MIAPEEVALSPVNLGEGEGPKGGGRSNQLNLTFQDVSYSVRARLISRERKKILSNVSGDFRPGELTAIMGPSGAGKTTLMNVLSGFATSSATGVVRVNGRTRDLAAFRRSSAYIMQDGNLQPLLTVQEVMRIAADLKLDTSATDKQLGVDVIIREMGLEKVRTTCTGKLSGGEQKRLTIALELISNPPIMFFDEPTSGLDSVSSRQCIGALKSLARDGRTVVCTIHQPSAPVLDMIDHLYVIANGSCVYTGKPRNLVKFLAELGLTCPAYHNPADYLLEIISGEHGDHIPKLVEAAKNGRNERWRDHHGEDQAQSLKIRDLDIIPKLPLPATSIFYEFDAKGPAYYATGFWRQWMVLMRRNVIKLSRDTVLVYARLFIHFIVAFLIGIIFFNSGNDASLARSNFNMMFFNIMTVMFNAFNSTITTFPEEMPILMREHFNRWYKLRSFFIAMKLTDFPIQIIAVTTYIVTVWLMSGQIMELWRLGFTILICILISLVAQNVGLMCGSVLNVKMGVIFGPLTILPFMIFSGFFVRMADAPPILHWLFHISIFKYAFEGVMIAIYGYDRQKMECSASADGLTYCHYSSPKILLKEFHMLYSDYWFAASVLFGLYVVLNVTAYGVLYFKLRKR